MESIQEGRGYGVNTGGKGLWSPYRREGVMESMQEGRGYGVNTGGKGLWSQCRREGVMELIQEGRGYGVNTGGKGLSYSLRLLLQVGHLSDSIRALL